ncbi:MAG: bifunctional 4-hydroxy-2-oxoglutarate aldolase/2-dehydro-3-deoxy-phosphogluconate aldolase [Clostridia bacterium]
MDMLQTLAQYGIVPVIKVDHAEEAVPLCRALSAGGLPVAEITFRTAAAEEAIRQVAQALPEVVLGAGTVLTIEQVQRAVAAGAGYIVSPGFNPKIVSYCVEHQIPVLPGCSNPSDIELALEMGLKTVKFFPAEAVGGLAAIRAMSAPYGDLTFVPTGGISEKNLCEYLAFPKILACGGSWMAKPEWIAAGDFASIESVTRTAVQKMLGFELAHIGVNCADADGALQLAQTLCKLLGWNIKEGNSSVFAGGAVEAMKKPGRGAKGHIAIATNSLMRAKAYLKRQDVVFDDTTDNGKAVYFAEEIAGFAFHLLQK